MDEKVGFFDVRIVGSGDYLIVCGDGFYGGLALEFVEFFDAVGELIKFYF